MSTPATLSRQQIAAQLHRIVPAGDIPAPEVRVRGQLLRDAIVRYSKGAAVLEAVVGQLDGPPIVIKRVYGDSNAAGQAAGSMAKQLRKGGHCTAEGNQLAPFTFDGQRALQLRGVTFISPDRYSTKDQS